MRSRFKLTLPSIERKAKRYWKHRAGKVAPIQTRELSQHKVIFVIPLMPTFHADVWSQVEKNLDVTLSSLVAQRSKNWHAIVVHHDMPKSIFFKHPHITFLEAPFSPETETQKGMRDAHRKRFLAGIWARENMPGTHFYFALDADDLVHSDFVTLVNYSQSDSVSIKVGWFIDASTGKVHWKKNFHLSCGSCFGAFFSQEEMPKDLGDLDSPYAQIMCGRHGEMADRAIALGKTPEELTFPMVSYVINHSESFAIKQSGTPRDWSFGQEVRRNDIPKLLDRHFGLKDWTYKPISPSP